MLLIHSTIVFVICFNLYQIPLIQSTGHNTPISTSPSSSRPNSPLAKERQGFQLLLDLIEQEDKQNLFDLLGLEIWKKGIRIIFGVYEKNAFMNLKLLEKLTKFEKIEICDNFDEIEEKLNKLNIIEENEQITCLDFKLIVSRCIKKFNKKKVYLSGNIAAKVEMFFREERCNCHRNQSLNKAKAKIVDGMPLFVFRGEKTKGRNKKDDSISHGGTSKIYHAYYYKEPTITQIEGPSQEGTSSKGKEIINEEVINFPLNSKCVALKIAKMDLIDDIDINKKLFLNEANVLKHFARKYDENTQSHIIRIFASETDETNRPKLVLELAERSLADDWEEQKNKPQPAQIIKKILKEMLIVLEQFHFDAIHLDLKLDNFMYIKQQEDLQLKLIDLGSSLLLREGQTYRYITKTDDSDIGYRSPEHYIDTGSRGFMFTTRTDIWALGVILFKMLLNDEEAQLFDKEFLYPIGKASEEDKKLLQEKIIKKVDEGKERTENGEMLEPLFNVVKLCLHLDPNMRPSASNLLLFIENKCIMELPNGHKISFNSQFNTKEIKECKPTRVTRQPQPLGTRRLFVQRLSPLSPKSSEGPRPLSPRSTI